MNIEIKPAEGRIWKKFYIILLYIYIVIYLIQYNKRGLNIPRCLLRSMGNDVKIYVRFLGGGCNYKFYRKYHAVKYIYRYIEK